MIKVNITYIQYNNIFSFLKMHIKSSKLIKICLYNFYWFTYFFVERAFITWTRIIVRVVSWASKWNPKFIELAAIEVEKLFSTGSTLLFFTSTVAYTQLILIDKVIGFEC